jgi:phytoene dehydrogenase-like protein
MDLLKSSSFSDTPNRTDYDCVVIGSGPNGLAAAIELAQAGRSVLVVEGHATPGGGMRSEELTLPGFVHDVCSAVHPMSVASPFMQRIGVDLAKFGLEFVHPEIALAHPLDGGDVAVMHRSLDETVAGLGRDGAAYQKMFAPLVRDADKLFGDLLGPLGIPKHPFAAAGFGVRALSSAQSLARGWFSTEAARALFAGNAAHSVMPLDRPLTSAVGLMLMVAGHAAGWPVAKGGSGAIAKAMVEYLQSLGGEVVCGWKVESLDELPKSRDVIFDTGPAALADIAADRLPESFRKRLRKFRYGPGVCKIDYALSETVPWASDDCRKAGTVHVGGMLDEIVKAERDPWIGRHSPKPFVLVAQQSVCDPTRAPQGKHTFWAYAHVPNGSEEDVSDAIEAQIERFAPGFRDCVIERSVRTADQYQRYNPNLVGGDVTGGANSWTQLLTRPVVRWRPHTTPDRGLFLCSASTPPGAGVHGMGGYWAARAALVKESGN